MTHVFSSSGGAVLEVEGSEQKRRAAGGGAGARHRDAGEGLQPERIEHLEGEGRAGEQVELAAGGSRCTGDRLLVDDLLAEARVESGARAIAERPAGARLRLAVGAVLVDLLAGNGVEHEVE